MDVTWIRVSMMMKKPWPTTKDGRPWPTCCLDASNYTVIITELLGGR
jgi:hypothetical protein